MRTRSAGPLIGALALFCSPLFTTSAFAEDLDSTAYEETQWSDTGISGGGTSIDVIDADTIEFEYDVRTSSSTYYRTAEYSVVAASSGTFSFAWEYNFFHSWFSVDADMWVWADGPSGRTEVQLVNFYNRSYTGRRVFSGMASITVHEGYDFGVRAGGRNGDRAGILQGKVTLDKFDAPADRDGDGVDDDDDACPDEDTATYYGYDVGADGCISDNVGPACPLAKAIKPAHGDFNNMASVWGVLATGDMTMSGASEGALRSVGDADLMSFNVGTKRLGAWAMASHNHLKARSGTFHGKVGARTSDLNKSVSFTTGSVVGQPGLHIDRFMEALSDDLAGQTVNGSTIVRPWGVIELSGSHPMLNVFEVDGSDFSSATALTVDVPADSSVLVNVDGTVVSYGPSGATYTGATASKTVFNFHEATDLTIGSISVDGQIVAPLAAVDVASGDIEGTLTGGDIAGTLTQYNAPYDGRVCATVKAAPGAAGCEATYIIGNTWSGGFIGDLTVVNTGPAVSSWDVDWSFSNGETISGTWGASNVQIGADVTASDLGWNGAVGTGKSVSIGIQSSGTPVKPSAFEFNGVSCIVK